MKKIFFILALLSLWAIWLVYAHSGNTDDYWCHTCYTNCEDYGLTYGQYHCHNTPAKTPSSYAGYAPSGSCKNEKKNIFNLETDLEQLKLSISNVKNDVEERY